MPATERLRSGGNELPSVALTVKFLALCRQYGAERLAVRGEDRCLRPQRRRARVAGQRRLVGVERRPDAELAVCMRRAVPDGRDTTPMSIVGGAAGFGLGSPDRHRSRRPAPPPLSRRDAP